MITNWSPALICRGKEKLMFHYVSNVPFPLMPLGVTLWNCNTNESWWQSFQLIRFTNCQLDVDAWFIIIIYRSINSSLSLNSFLWSTTFFWCYTISRLRYMIIELTVWTPPPHLPPNHYHNHDHNHDHRLVIFITIITCSVLNSGSLGFGNLPPAISVLGSSSGSVHTCYGCIVITLSCCGWWSTRRLLKWI